MAADDADIASFLASSRSIEELYEVLADSAGLGADEINKAGAGKSLFSRIWMQQRSRVCSNTTVPIYMNDPNTADATDIVTTLMTLLVVVPGINMVVVACLAIRVGLRSLCSQSAQ